MYVSLDNERQKIIFTNKTYMMTLLNSVIFKQNKKTPIWSNISYKIEKFSVSYSEFSIKQGIKKKLLIMRNPIR